MRWSKKYTRIIVLKSMNLKARITILRMWGMILQYSYPCSERYSETEQKALKVMQMNTAKITQWNIIWRQYWYNMIKKWPATAYYVRASVDVSEGIVFLSLPDTSLSTFITCQSRVESSLFKGFRSAFASILNKY